MAESQTLSRSRIGIRRGGGACRHLCVVAVGPGRARLEEQRLCSQLVAEGLQRAAAPEEAADTLAVEDWRGVVDAVDRVRVAVLVEPEPAGSEAQGRPGMAAAAVRVWVVGVVGVEAQVPQSGEKRGCRWLGRTRS